MRRLVLTAVAVAALGGLAGTGPASAYCDPDYEPFCSNECHHQPPDLRDLHGWLFRVCPD